jgi:hypothetical protein
MLKATSFIFCVCHQTFKCVPKTNLMVFKIINIFIIDLNCVLLPVKSNMKMHEPSNF